MKKYISYLLAGLIGLGLASCKKYALQGNIPGAAYLRVFNDIPFTATLVNQEQPVPFFTMLIDPQFGSGGIPVGGAIVGDYLGTRQVFNPSYPFDEGNALSASINTTTNNYDINYEYPGNTHVLTAPPMNGFDVSAWAQVPSGRHRFLFVSRPQNNAPFASLSDSIRSRVLIDTTVDLEQGELYTMETVLENIDSSRYGVYMRQEDFMKQSFANNQDYLSFYNLSSAKSVFSNSKSSAASAYFPDTMNVYYTYLAFVDDGGTSSAVPFFPITGLSNNFIGGVQGRMAPHASYNPLPLLPMSYMYDLQGNLRSEVDTEYYNGSTGYYALPVEGSTEGSGAAAAYWGTMPYLVFNFLSPGNSLNTGNTPTTSNQYFILTCNLNPQLTDNLSSLYLDPDSHANKQDGLIGVQLMANLICLTQSGNNAYQYPAVYIVELVNNVVYMMQVQKVI